MNDEKCKYAYAFFDGDEWLEVLGQTFDTPEEAKKAGVEAGFEYVRVIDAVSGLNVNPL